MATSVGELKGLAQSYLDKSLEGLTGISPLTVMDYKNKVNELIEGRPDMTDVQLLGLLILKANENVAELDEDGNFKNVEPGWVYLTARLFAESLYIRISSLRGVPKNDLYSGESFLKGIGHMLEEGVYNPELIYSYEEEELHAMGELMKAHKYCDMDFNFIGLKLLAERYLAKNYEQQVIELPQERFMMIALNNHMNADKSERMALVEESYWALRNRYMTSATPTFANSGKAYGQFASCFIDIMGDSLESIYLNNLDVAKVSKDGGGIGVYIGKVRAQGSDIKNVKGVSSGQLPWGKQLDNTASSVDQLGQRQGSITLFNDIWHKDIVKFLDSKLNNGEEREKLHTVSLGLCLPDIYMRKLAKKEKFYLFDPYMVEKVMGFRIEDFYDKEKLKHGVAPDKEKHAFSYHYELCVNTPELPKEEINPLELHTKIAKVRKESGFPYMFYRDTANRMNPNKHVEGSMIYCMNICTEIAQNMSATEVLKEYKEYRGDKVIIHTERVAGDFVVCTLSSINLAETVPMGDEHLERVINNLALMLDNTIDLNAPRLSVLQAEETTSKYRAFGIGTFGWHHLLALEGIEWESEEAVERCDELYEKIAFYVIKASMNLAKKRGAYPMFEGSDWHTGEYFELRGYSTATSKAGVDWDWLKREVMEHGMRNGYVMAVAPNASTAKMGGSTDGIDPIFMAVYTDEKKRSKDITVAPDLNMRTRRLYKSAYAVDQMWSIKQNARRAVHVDQGISFNIYVGKDVTATQIMKYDLVIWNSGIKSSYYTRSLDVNVKECESCEG